MTNLRLKLDHFISDPISVRFNTPPAFSKNPPCPSEFIWQNQSFKITACLHEWHDFERRGRMARNMQPQHAARAEKQGSWGVGRFYFEVQTGDPRYFRLYYDRAPKDATDRGGGWILLAELSPDED